MKLNKATAADTASLIYEDNFSGRAEIGLTGDDAFHVKVSPNGSTWFEALNIAQASGLVTLPIGQLAFPATQNPSANANTLDDYEEGTWTPSHAVRRRRRPASPTARRRSAATPRSAALVIATCMLTLTSKGTSTGAAQIAGLPFTALNDAIYSSAAVGFATGFVERHRRGARRWSRPTRSRINLYHSTNGAGVSAHQRQFRQHHAIYFTVCYERA